jgi:hypothetical protein
LIALCKVFHLVVVQRLPSHVIRFQVNTLNPKIESKTMSEFTLIPANVAPEVEIEAALSTAQGVALVSAKGNIIGKKFIFNLGDTKAMKAEIARQNPSWTKTKVANHLAVVRRDNLSASRLEAAAFVEYQYSRGNVAVSGDHKDSGKSVLRFEKAVTVESKKESELKKENEELKARMAKLEAALGLASN